MAFRDLREYIQAIDKIGELLHIEAEVDWYLEAGAVVRRANEIGAPAPWFKNIKDYSQGYTILGAPLAGSHKGKYRRFACALELRPDTTYLEMVDELIRRMKTPLRPIRVATGPCKENIHTGKEVNLLEFPAPVVHDGDGGRYISTWNTVVTKDPDSDWVNWGMYRQMVHTKNTLGGLVHPMQHIGMMYYQKYEVRGKPMSFACAIATEPVTAIASAWMFPAGVNEADMIGALRRDPLELVKCETNDLYVPATSEIVIEGEMRPYERWDEGPFGEFTGYRASPRMPRPVYRVTAITHRNNPILTMSCMGVPIDDCAIVQNIGLDVMAMQFFREMKWPVRGVYTPPETIGNLAIISSAIPYSHFADQLVSAYRSQKFGVGVPYIIVIEDDVDPTNVMQVLHALVTKCHPYRGINKVEHSTGHALLPFLNLEERQYALGCYASFDCSWPKHWDPSIAIPPKSKFDEIYPKEVQQKVLDRWMNDYGYEDMNYGY